MPKILNIIGLGPGDLSLIPPQTMEVIENSTDFFGYFPYVARLELKENQIVHGSDNRQELDRANAALKLANEGRKVCVVSGGDPGVFAMAAAICEAIDKNQDEYKDIEIRTYPAVTAVLALAARIGAPLGHDFCVISLSDNLKPWEIIEKRLIAAADCGLVISLYNPISKARPKQLDVAFDVLRKHLDENVLVVFGRAINRPDESIKIVSIKDAKGEMADMSTCVIIGTKNTKIIKRPDANDLVYSPRFWS